MEPSSIINYQFFAKTDQEAVDLAKKFFEFDQAEGGMICSAGDHDVRLHFLSAENMCPKVHCIGGLDCIVAMIPDDMDDETEETVMGHFEVQKCYGVIVVFNFKEMEDEEKGVWSYKKEMVDSDKAKSMVIDKPFEIHNKLKAAFDSMTVDANGRICEADVSKVAAQLREQDTSSDKTGEGWRNGALTFDQVKASYFISCKERDPICEADTIRKIIRKIFYDQSYLEAFVDGFKIDCEETDPSRIDVLVGEESEIERGIGVKTSFRAGSAFSETAEGLPEDHQNLPFIITFRAKIKDSSYLKEISKYASMFRIMCAQSGKLGKHFIRFGGGVSAYIEDDYLYFEIKPTGAFTPEFAFIKEELTKLDESSLTCDTEMFTSLTFSDLANASLDEIAGKLAKFRFVTLGEGKKLPALLAWMVILLDTAPIRDLDLPKQVKTYFSTIVKMVETFKSFENKMIFDTDRIKGTLSSAIPEEIKEMFAQMRPEMIGAAKGMKEELGPMADKFEQVINSIDLDQLVVEISSSYLKATGCLELRLPGLTEEILNAIKE